MAEAMATASDDLKAECSSEQKSDVKIEGGQPSTAKKPTCIIVIGMAGSGKTTFVQVWSRCISWFARPSTKSCSKTNTRVFIRKSL